MKIDYKDYIEHVETLSDDVSQRERKINFLFSTLQEKDNSHLLIKVAGDEDTPPELLEKLSYVSDLNVLLEVAKNRSSPYFALEHLSKSKEESIRLSVAQNLSSPFVALYSLSLDENKDIQNQAKDTLAEAGEMGKKYDLDLSDTISFYDEFIETTLYRVLYYDGIKGGYIENESNLSQEGNCRVLENARVFENATVEGNAIVKGEASMWGYSIAKDNAVLDELSCAYNSAVIGGTTKLLAVVEACGGAVLLRGKYDNGVVTKVQEEKTLTQSQKHKPYLPKSKTNKGRSL